MRKTGYDSAVKRAGHTLMEHALKRQVAKIMKIGLSQSEELPKMPTACIEQGDEGPPEKFVCGFEKES